MSWLEIDSDGGVRWLTLNRPDRRNAIPTDGWSDLGDAFKSFEDSDDRVLVVTGAGEDFCAGADLDPSRVEEFESIEDRHMRMKRVGEVALALHRLTKPTIAAVDGVAVGAGMNLALGCDVVIATPRSRFSEIFVKRGLTLDFGGSWLLPRIVGLQRARELALSGRIVTGQELVDIGLALELVEPTELRARATGMAQAFMEGAPRAQAFIKQTLGSAYQSSLSEALGWEGQAQSILLGTDDFVEGVMSFIERRDPDWKGT